MMMPSLVDLTFGMRCILFHSLGFLVLLLLKPHQSWSNVKTIKNGKRANIGGKSLEKRAILYTSAKLEEAQLLKCMDSCFIK